MQTRAASHPVASSKYSAAGSDAGKTVFVASSHSLKLNHGPHPALSDRHATRRLGSSGVGSAGSPKTLIISSWLHESVPVSLSKVSNSRSRLRITFSQPYAGANEHTYIRVCVRIHMSAVRTYGHICRCICRRRKKYVTTRPGKV